VKKKDVFASLEEPFPRQIDASDHGLAGIYRVQENDFGGGQQPDRIHHSVGGQGIAGPHTGVKAADGIFRHAISGAHPFRRPDGQVMYQRLLFLFAAADIDAGDGDSGPVALHAGQNTGMGARRAAGHDHVIDGQSHNNCCRVSWAQAAYPVAPVGLEAPP